MFETLDQVLTDANDRLTRAARDRTSPMHVPVVGTGDGDLRMMVLRESAEGISRLRFHTDARSPKARLIGAGGPVSVLAFDPAEKVQLRLRGIGRIELHGPGADAAWAAATAFAGRCYLADAAPGMTSDAATSGVPKEVEGIRPSEAQLIPARENFAVLLFEPHSLDWLHLAHSGHRRAQFTRGSDGAWQGTWVVP